MTTTCDLAAQSMGTGVSAALSAVDCIAATVSEQAFNRLFGTEGQLAFALTVLLGLYVAFFGISLMLGRSNLSVRALLPRMMTLGLVLTFATSFVAFSTIFYNIFIGGPDQIAGILTGAQGESATAVFAQKLDVVFLAIQQASGDTKDIAAFSPPGMMWMGAMLLLLGTVGLLVTARIALALLLAVGPIFVVLALFEGTRGLFTGWLKGLTMMALAPLFAVLGGSIMLEMAVPVLAALVAVPGQIDQQAAMAFFVVGAVHMALMLLSLKVASSMVAGWQVFGLVPDKEHSRSHDSPRSVPVPQPVGTAPRNTNVAPTSPGLAPRRVDLGVLQTVTAANDAGPAGTASRETRVYATGGGGGQVVPLNPATSRTRGIGNRFRSASSAKPVPAPKAPSGDLSMTRAALLASLALCLALSPSEPVAAQDNRLQTLVFDENVVVRIDGKVKVQTTIKFAPDEVIENVAIGDSAAWQVQPNKAQSILFVKPLETDARTNMTVVTDKRTYLFDLVASPRNSALYVLQFRYPELEKAAEEARLAAIAEAEAQAIRALEAPEEVAVAADPYSVSDPANLNFAWASAGARDLLPSRAYDNGNAVFLTWPRGVAIPAILVTNAAGEEGPVNYTVRGDTLVVDGVPPQIILRSGRDTATITNTGPMAPSARQAELTAPRKKGS